MCFFGIWRGNNIDLYCVRVIRRTMSKIASKSFDISLFFSEIARCIELDLDLDIMYLLFKIIHIGKLNNPRHL